MTWSRETPSDRFVDDMLTTGVYVAPGPYEDLHEIHAICMEILLFHPERKERGLVHRLCNDCTDLIVKLGGVKA